jgi:hypothetical protein
VLGLPFQSGLAAGGDPRRELRFDLSTAFASGPALRLSYRPNDSGLPFALAVRAGLGPLGSPARAPFVLAAEFNLLSSDPSTPAFFLRLKPRLGDFSLSHTLRSAADGAAPAPRKVGEAPPDADGLGHGREQEFGYRPPFSFTGSGLAAAGTKSGVGALLSGMRLTTRSVLPLWGGASLRFNWGLRVPPELLADGGGGRSSKGARARQQDAAAGHEQALHRAVPARRRGQQEPLPAVRGRAGRPGRRRGGGVLAGEAAAGVAERGQHAAAPRRGGLVERGGRRLKKKLTCGSHTSVS